MQAITTKYLGPTNHRGSRVKATCEAGSVIVGWDHALDSQGNHDAACRAMALKMGWHGHWLGGGLPSTAGNAYVCVRRIVDGGMAVYQGTLVVVKATV